ncbi:MAG: HAD-IA family hydrolase [Pseudomonadota bacterium]
MTRLRVAIFDVDGTLVDSQRTIISCMDAAFRQMDLTVPPPETIRRIVGLSLPVAIDRLAPEVPRSTQDRIVDAYKTAYANQRIEEGIAGSPLYPGALKCLDRLGQDDHVLLAVATGKSRRGLNLLLGMHGLDGRFVSTQVADDHPSKPNPSMVEAILRETGAEAAETVMIGDTSFDMEMGQAAGLRRLGVSWGYHSVDALEAAGAEAMAHQFDEVVPLLEHFWEQAHV